MNIDPKNITCFGFSLPRKESWYMVLHKAASDGWRAIDQKQFESNLDKNVKDSYEYMVKIEFKDLDTDFDYVVRFDNKIKMWEMVLPGSDEDAIDKKDKTEFFKSDLFKKTCKRADEILTNALKSCQNMIVPEVKRGRFINLDEIKFEAIIDMLNDPMFMKNLKRGKHT